MIAAAFPPNRRDRGYNWEGGLEEFLRASPDDSVLDIDMAMGLDRFFGLPDGWWYQLMARYYVLRELRENSVWLDEIRVLRGARVRVRSTDSLLRAPRKPRNELRCCEVKGTPKKRK